MAASRVVTDIPLEEQVLTPAGAHLVGEPVIEISGLRKSFGAN
jgi:hypothetical protein